MKVVLVTGSRDHTDARLIGNYLAIEDPDVVIHGAARGADTLAEDWARSHEVPYYGYPAKWKSHGKKAGPIRNQQMLGVIEGLRASGHDVTVLAFPLPNSKGTHHMVAIARAGEPPFDVQVVE